MIKRILFILRYPNFKFDSEIWKSDKSRRCCFINKILNKREEIGITKEELAVKFRHPCKIYDSGVWSYEVPDLWVKKKKRVLNFYFDENERVKDIKVKYRIRQRLNSHFPYRRAD